MVEDKHVIETLGKVRVVIENGVKGKYAMQVAKDLLDGYFK